MSTDIQQIENLWQFTNLTKLQLDNNIISDVKGLETLVHLEWLGTVLLTIAFNSQTFYSVLDKFELYFDQWGPFLLEVSLPCICTALSHPTPPIHTL